MSDHFVDANKTASLENTPETKRCSKDTIYRQAAIEEVETRLKSAYVWYDNEVLRDDYALSVKAEGAISALIECVLMLKGLPSAEPDVPDTSVGDMISRQAAIDALLGITAIRNTIPLDSAIFNIKKLPAAEPGPCDVCVYNEDCEEMRIYCPARPVERQTERSE